MLEVSFLIECGNNNSDNRDITHPKSILTTHTHTTQASKLGPQYKYSIA